MIYFDSGMSKSTNTVVYFDWRTVIYIYVCGQCRTQFMLPNSSRRYISPLLSISDWVFDNVWSCSTLFIMKTSHKSDELKKIKKKGGGGPQIGYLCCGWLKTLDKKNITNLFKFFFYLVFGMFKHCTLVKLRGVHLN